MKNKFTSRKFLAMIAGVLTGIALIITGNVTEGTVTVVSAIVGYFVAEGYIDAKAVNKGLDGAQDVAQGVKDTVVQGFKDNTNGGAAND